MPESRVVDEWVPGVELHAGSCGQWYVTVSHVDGGGQLRVDRVGFGQNLSQPGLQLQHGDQRLRRKGLVRCRDQLVRQRIDGHMQLGGIVLECAQFGLHVLDVVGGLVRSHGNRKGLVTVGVEVLPD
ncbi:hypothetical protein PT015_17410 [Candidatus Mycobacterium wuenschmannii]|uniref:Transposase n=1 Tax=Candidatus Mycobacterium wuenschmannii TaxID=3027808 RepID=A0ABY8VT22_9MYCO|nr:hypothetical protein [Candidatus Mycobacterium wuenschmannii]WIM86657.1 hypothetical protein PT015_17410 [Candidatus Mycobacterium wuenschmannii]